MNQRLAITPAAADVLNKIRAQHGPLMFHQSGGCCDGSSPMCYAVGDFIIGSQDVWLGQIDGCDFWMSGDQFEYWQHTHLTIDVTPVTIFFANISLLIRVVNPNINAITNRALVNGMANKTIEKVEEEYKDQKVGGGDNGTGHGSTGTRSSTSHKSSKKSKGSSSAGGSTGGSKGGHSN